MHVFSSLAAFDFGLLFLDLIQSLEEGGDSLCLSECEKQTRKWGDEEMRRGR